MSIQTTQLLTPDASWDQVVADLDQDPAEGLNVAHECCGRYVGDRGRLAIAFHHPDGTSERWTFYELARAASRAARMFADLGLRREDRVASLLSRQPEAWICALAAWRSGLVYVPLFSGFGTEALVQRLGPAEPKAVVVDYRWRAGLDAARERLRVDPVAITIAGPRGTGLEHGDRSFWAELERSEPDGPVAATTVSDLATIMFTSGTTGAPKGCLMPHSGFVSLMPFVRHCFALTPSDVLFATSDPAWSYGLFTTGATPMAMGIPRVIYTGDFDAAAWVRAIGDEQITYIGGAPTAYRALTRALRRIGSPDCLRGATSAGEPLDADTVEAWHEATSTEIRDGYGLSEIGMPLANLGDPQLPVTPGALAAVVPGFDVRLVTSDGEEVGEGEEGIIAVRRPRFQLSTGYLNDEDAWRRRWVGDLFLTEDLARVDETGRWWFTGRADDVIVTSGYNVGPVEVESVLLEHPGVVEAAAVAAPDPARGSIVRAVVVRAADAPAAEMLTEELQAAVRERVGRHAYPRIVDYVDALPRTETGKLRRAALRQPASEA